MVQDGSAIFQLRVTASCKVLRSSLKRHLGPCQAEDSNVGPTEQTPLWPRKSPISRGSGPESLDGYIQVAPSALSFFGRRFCYAQSQGSMSGRF